MGTESKTEQYELELSTCSYCKKDDICVLITDEKHICQRCAEFVFREKRILLCLVRVDGKPVHCCSYCTTELDELMVCVACLEDELGLK